MTLLTLNSKNGGSASSKLLSASCWRPPCAEKVANATVQKNISNFFASIILFWFFLILVSFLITYKKGHRKIRQTKARKLRFFDFVGRSSHSKCLVVPWYHTMWPFDSFSRLNTVGPNSRVAENPKTGNNFIGQKAGKIPFLSSFLRNLHKFVCFVNIHSLSI